MENNTRYLEACGAGERAGLYYTCINSFLTADEVAFIINNSESKVLITSEAKAQVAADALKQCPTYFLGLRCQARCLGAQPTPSRVHQLPDSL